MKCKSKAKKYTLLLEVWTQICRWSNMRMKVQKVKSGSKKKGKKSFLKCMYSRSLGERVRKRISPIKKLAGRGVGSSGLAQPYHSRMSSACMGKPPCLHSSRGEVEGLCSANTSAPVCLFSMPLLMKPYTWSNNWLKTSATISYISRSFQNFVDFD